LLDDRPPSLMRPAHTNGNKATPVTHAAPYYRLAYHQLIHGRSRMPAANAAGPPSHHLPSR
jgi:hypothetical protein